VLGSDTPESELIVRDRPLDELLPEAFTQHNDELLQLPLYELVERLYDIFQLQCVNEQSAYLCAFYDQLAKFTQDNTTDIDAFIREWDETISGKTIHSDISDGIRILSIHKSKGLEFDHVLIPFCSWRLEQPDVLWCQPQESPYNALPIVPVDYSARQMMGTVYEDDYRIEHLQNCVDNLNLLYVAFTRASRNLFVFGQRGSKLSRSALIEGVLPALKLDGSTLEGVDNEDQPLSFTYGTLAVSSRQHAACEKKSANVFLQPVTTESVTMASYSMKTEFRQSNKSRDFIEGDDESSELSYIKIGSVLHDVFSTIHTTADIEPALQQMQQDGVLYDDDVTRERLLSMLHKRLESKIVKDWFSDRWKLFNECSILQEDDNGNVIVRRPDRVMTDGHETHVVDFKFGSTNAEYHDQVREYMQLLSEMGMPNVCGWLWYVYSNRIEKVSMNSEKKIMLLPKVI
jgi:ATP-dependent exoDNAse (exonuclease V) beta subunit